MYFSKILYTGKYVPEKVVTNNDLSQIVDTNDEWIVSRTGIGKRHVSLWENTSDIASKVAENIMSEGKINPLDIELIIVATVSPDYITPSAACLVQAKLNAKNAIAFDVNAACSGFVYALSIADKFIKSGVYKNALVIGSEILSKHVDWSDRSTCVLFGDGAGGVYIERSEEKTGLLCEDIGSDGSKGMSLTGGFIPPTNAFNNIEKSEDIYLSMDGRAVFEFATRQIPKSILKLIEKSEININDIKCIIPHQANSRIVEVIAKKTKIPMDKFYLNMFNYGNTSSASIPIALAEMAEKSLIAKGDKFIITGFGGGLTWGSMLIEF